MTTFILLLLDIFLIGIILYGMWKIGAIASENERLKAEKIMLIEDYNRMLADADADHTRSENEIIRSYNARIADFRESVNTLRSRGDKYRDALDKIISAKTPSMASIGRKMVAIAEEARGK